MNSPAVLLWYLDLEVSAGPLSIFILAYQPIQKYAQAYASDHLDYLRSGKSFCLSRLDGIGSFFTELDKGEKR